MSNEKTKKITTLAILTAAIVVVQALGNLMSMITGGFSISLVLVPIVLGATLLGAKSGAFLGAAFGVMTYIYAAIGVDLSGNMLFVASPLILLLVCVVKGAAAGFVAGVIFKAVSHKNRQLGTLLAAVAAPIINTALFCISMPIFFSDVLAEWAGGTPILEFIIIGCAGINFFIELGINLISSPIIPRVVDAVNKRL